jgi:hypothetical protein
MMPGPLFSHPENNMEDYTFEELNDVIYTQLKDRYLADASSLSKGEKEALAMAAFVRFADLNEQSDMIRDEALKWLWAGITRCRLIIDQYESGEYAGDLFNDYLDVFGDRSIEAEQVACKYHDDEALEKMYALDDRFMQLTD